MNQRADWWKPALVLAIDLLWSLLLERLGRPLFLGLFWGQETEVNRLLDSQLIPMLWISYGIVLAAQIGWLRWLSRQRRRWGEQIGINARLRLLRRTWWWCALGQLALSTGLQASLAWRLGRSVDPAGLVFVGALLLCDLLVIYWLPTTLLVPAELRSAIPPWRPASSASRDHRQIEP